MSSERTILVLGGGPDAERQVSLTSARFVGDALEKSGRFRVNRQTIDTVSNSQLARLEGDVIFPVLHGGWGEGGQLQEILERDGRPFVGSGSRAARAAMDKLATKMIALREGIATPVSHILDLRDPSCPLPLPVIIKPVHEGSTIGLHVVTTKEHWLAARRQIGEEQLRAPAGSAAASRVYMIEPKIAGRELTVGLIDGEALPIIEIAAASGLYDYEAKYHRSDTTYTLDPALPAGVAHRVNQQSVTLAGTMGVRHLGRADFMLDAAGTAWLLEINTIPGFTDHSLVPMAARHRGIEMPELCATLVDVALRDAPTAIPAR
ncbi:MAG: D-alanine--D-alanine ligase [Phycisphaerales bacterium]|nr:D-alanine--D-alanine ligase [Phycisphaerales bacterium]